MIIRSKSDAETQAFGFKLGKKLKKARKKMPFVLCLFGHLGTGKTTFIRGLAKGLGLTSRITSPTFTYQRVHEGKPKLYHFDCYRLSKPDELLMHDLYEALENRDGVIAIEWSDKIKHRLPEKHTDIYFEYVDENTREIKISNLTIFK
ncbi:tRNA (adenosine(37)-N6)-threonylcarbamoyltransferase complex ATPase subunit type 1 TsaE [Candidatus Peregrinibacteria bacterium]|nr:tRNA (adenosine(37)-N6)-threonylcarbamoyltransferase complex ATPase subunit type 1 TsaE [Candidatus Peregrinibacteria bacterium]